jgi:hypothetical protein
MVKPSEPRSRTDDALHSQFQCFVWKIPPTQLPTIDIWFEDTTDPRIGAAVHEAGGIWISGSFGMQPPRIGGYALGDRLDVVVHMHGLGNFAEEMSHTTIIEVDHIPLRVLRLERIIESKRVTGRKKDLAAIPALEEALAALADTV